MPYLSDDVESGPGLGQESLARLSARLDASRSQVTAESWENQLKAAGRWSAGEDSFAMARRLRDSVTVLYGDSGHGFLFQHPDEFGRQVLDFLR